jgi:uncharacterized repeat protein (TIGR04042 family)
MPEMTFELRWPDGSRECCYSPSLVVHDYLKTGATYTIADFLDRAGTALAEASDRVRAKFGFACTSAAATNDEINEVAKQFEPTALIRVIAMQPTLEKP